MCTWGEESHGGILYRANGNAIQCGMEKKMAAWMKGAKKIHQLMFDCSFSGSQIFSDPRVCQIWYPETFNSNAKGHGHNVDRVIGQQCFPYDPTRYFWVERPVIMQQTP